jgi:hypothetical protein
MHAGAASAESNAIAHTADWLRDFAATQHGRRAAKGEESVDL